MTGEDIMYLEVERQRETMKKYGVSNPVSKDQFEAWVRHFGAEKARALQTHAEASLRKEDKE